MIFSTMSVAIGYGIIGVVAAGVLPISEVAFKPLTLVAEKTLPHTLYLLFVIGGA